MNTLTKDDVLNLHDDFKQEISHFLFHSDNSNMFKLERARFYNVLELKFEPDHEPIIEWVNKFDSYIRELSDSIKSTYQQIESDKKPNYDKESAITNTFQFMEEFNSMLKNYNNFKGIMSEHLFNEK